MDKDLFIRICVKRVAGVRNFRERRSTPPHGFPAFYADCDHGGDVLRIGLFQCAADLWMCALTLNEKDESVAFSAGHDPEACLRSAIDQLFN